MGNQGEEPIILLGPVRHKDAGLPAWAGLEDELVPLRQRLQPHMGSCLLLVLPTHDEHTSHVWIGWVDKPRLDVRGQARWFRVDLPCRSDEAIKRLATKLLTLL